MTEKNILETFKQELFELEAAGNLRVNSDDVDHRYCDVDHPHLLSIFC